MMRQELAETAVIWRTPKKGILSFCELFTKDVLAKSATVEGVECLHTTQKKDKLF